MKQGWKIRPFEKCIEKVKYTTKIATCDYSTMGAYPVVSQEEEYISGYWNNAEDVYKVSKPVVIFGDHTRVLKYVDFDFVLGADGVKILQPIDAINAKFFLYYLIASKIPSLGYSRHYKLLKELNVPVPPIAEQEKIVAELDCLSGIIEKKKQQLKELDALAQSIFYEMFGDPVENDKGWNVQGFSTACDVITDFVAAGSFADIKKNVQYKESQDYAQLVRTTDLKNKFMKSGFVYISESAFNYLWRVNLNQECIILPNVGVNCGEVYYVNPSMLPYSNNVLGPNAILVRSKKENHRYLSALFTTSYFQCQLKGIVNAVGQPKFNKTELKKLEVILPPLPLQQDFASKIESIEKQKELIAQSIKETETLFNSRMDYYFN